MGSPASVPDIFRIRRERMAQSGSPKLVVLVHAPGADADELGAVKGVQEFVDACDALRPTDRALTGGLFADGFVDLVHVVEEQQILIVEFPQQKRFGGRPADGGCP